MSATALRERLASLGGAPPARPAPRPQRLTPAGFEEVTTPWGTALKRVEVISSGRTPHGRRAGFGYLDTETTGLSGGTGTYVFAAALARPCGGGMEVIQLFLHEPGAEAAFLHALWEEVETCRAIATYNGASFDLPLLRTRWVMARMPGEAAHPPHHDLLTLTRALWRHRLESCTLRAVEERLLDFEREGDIPGALIPATYLGYLRTGWHPDLEGTLEHNRQDVISLYHLHQRVLERMDGRDSIMDAADWLALGRLLIRRRQRAAGWRALRHAAELREGTPSAQAAILLARRLARRGAPASAETLLGWVQEAIPADTGLTIARARLLEWRLRRPAEALALVEAALAAGRHDQDLPRRHARLMLRVRRAEAGSRARGVSR